jgi:hypothetical protein
MKPGGSPTVVVLLAIGILFYIAQVTLVIQGHTKNGALCGIVGSLSIVVGLLLKFYVDHESRTKNKVEP